MSEQETSLKLLLDAIRFAADKHRDQRRKDPRVSPYINHPIEVAAELTAAGVTETSVLTAAVLHDTIEDTWTTPEEVERNFGQTVRTLVESVTDDKRLPKDERKRLQIEKAATLLPQSKLLKLADKICNVVVVTRTPPVGWSRDRRLAYLRWTEDVVAGCRGVNPELEARYDAVLAEGLQRLSGAAGTEGHRFVAVDWSGAKQGARKSIWIAEAKDGRLVRLERGGSREQVVDHVIDEARRDPQLVAGFDFAFSFPEWFLKARGLSDVRALWALVEREGEGWLASCEPPFWGRPGKRRPRIPADYRLTEQKTLPVGSSKPKSVFQIGGAGAVGTGSIRGMPFLKRLVEAGFSVWPFDPLRVPAVVEIYPRILTGEVVKSSEEARESYLRARFPGLCGDLREKAVSNEDAFDAAVSALVMAAHGEELLALPAASDRRIVREGEIWLPGG